LNSGLARARQADVRVVPPPITTCARKIVEKHFREDLYYRLSMVEIKIPALADRKEDLPLLQRFLIHKIRRPI
jgi:transcriptional regulator with PAS, ATPase and Fis domain